MPDFQDRVIQGSGTRGNVGTYKAESLPNITGNSFGSFFLDFTDYGSSLFGSTVSSGYQGKIANGNAGSTGNQLNLDASRSSSTYQNGAPVQSNALLIQCCIKY